MKWTTHVVGVSLLGRIGTFLAVTVFSIAGSSIALCENFPAATDPSPSLTISLEFELKPGSVPVHRSLGCGPVVPLFFGEMSGSEQKKADLWLLLGIRETDRTFVACLGDYRGGPSQVVAGRSAVSLEVRHTLAAVHDRSAMSLYLDGSLEVQARLEPSSGWTALGDLRLGVSRNPVHAVEGRLEGTLTGLQLWDRALTDNEIRENAGPEPGADAGTDSGVCPDQPRVVSPDDREFGLPTSVTLEVELSDPEGDCTDVSFYGREIPPVSRTFTVVALPDTQYYSKWFPELFKDQTWWIRRSAKEMGIEMATHLGDLVDQYDLQVYEWENADRAMRILDGHVPYGIAPGNHDLDPGTNFEGVYYDQYFPASRYEHEPWYGEGYRNNKNSYQLFSVEGLDFMVIHLEYQPSDDTLDWARQIMAEHPGHRVILSTHEYLMADGTRSTTIYRTGGNAGEDLWQKLVKGNCNIFMVLNGHYHFLGGENRLTSQNDCGGDVYQVLQNYQHRLAGGDGWLRYYTFHPGDNRIEAYTYTPTYDLFETDDDSEFTLSYEMGGTDFELLATRSCVPSGSRASTSWTGLGYGTRYQWYVTVDDGTCIATGPRWSFVTENDCSDPALDDDSCDAVDDDCDGEYDEDYPVTPTVCGLGECAGNQGEMRCAAGYEVDTCAPLDGASEEYCDGLDNDCNGITDDPFSDTDRDGEADCVDDDDDGDNIVDTLDNCPMARNTEQRDSDSDGIGDLCDLCPMTVDPGQEDRDLDHIGDACDNCPEVINYSQGDSDYDGEGDHCDLDDGRIFIYFAQSDVLARDPETRYDHWNLYRGVLDELKETGVYTQAPMRSHPAARFCNLATNSFSDPVIPEKGKELFYLATGLENGIESSLGYDSAGEERTNHQPCP